MLQNSRCAAAENRPRSLQLAPLRPHPPRRKSMMPKRLGLAGYSRGAAGWAWVRQMLNGGNWVRLAAFAGTFGFDAHEGPIVFSE
jgi:hypothetical protein